MTTVTLRRMSRGLNIMLMLYNHTLSWTTPSYFRSTGIYCITSTWREGLGTLGTTPVICRNAGKASGIAVVTRYRGLCVIIELSMHMQAQIHSRYDGYWRCNVVNFTHDIDNDYIPRWHSIVPRLSAWWWCNTSSAIGSRRVWFMRLRRYIKYIMCLYHGHHGCRCTTNSIQTLGFPHKFLILFIRQVTVKSAHLAWALLSHFQNKDHTHCNFSKAVPIVSRIRRVCKKLTLLTLW